ncbi:MAG: alpha-glucan family phosphorylase [Phototrophicaceae bacterium]
MVKPIARIHVSPDLPTSLDRLRELAVNLRWSWDHESIALFRRMSPELWTSTGQNPIQMLGLMNQERLQELVEDSAFMTHYHNVCEDFDSYMGASNTWYRTHYGDLNPQPLIAYFSMEFGLTESFQNYSGGLGILSGDHLKSASDLDIPLIGIGLLYQEGYFHQYLSSDGFQQETYPFNDLANLPLTLVRDDKGQAIHVSVPLPGRELFAQVWKVAVGRISLYLLDSNIELNHNSDDRNLTARLYGGDRRTRIRQEILMGIGGIRLLDKLSLRPTVLHMNEGHSAFLVLERIYQLMQEQHLNFEEAKVLATSNSIFTTHTPVPAGLERFDFELIDEHLSQYIQSFGISRDKFMDLGREHAYGKDMFSMALMALRLSAKTNGVAKLHAEVSRNLWQWNYPNIPNKEVPIDAVTNGIHVRTWLSREMEGLFDRYLDPQWRNDESDLQIWEEGVKRIPDAELWRTHSRRRERLVAFARQRLRMQLERRGASQKEIQAADEILNPDALTIGFARRFATYKRATMVMRDVERIRRIVNNPDYPIQFVFAGKAHPHDNPGKEFIREIDRLSRTEDFRYSLVFLEDYDMFIARYMYQGVDIWLNTPRRPKEASGTSGMKVLANGGLNFSILDGWWAEGYTPGVGWAIGSGEEYSPEQEPVQDQLESEALYTVLEHDIIPLFYDRGRDGLPRRWIEKMKNSMIQLTPTFSTRRMVREYTEEFYLPVFKHYRNLIGNDLQNVKHFTQWQHKIRQGWNNIHISGVEIQQDHVKVGQNTSVAVNVYLGSLSAEDVQVEVYYGQLDARGEIISDKAETATMNPVGTLDNNGIRYKAELVYNTSGERGISVRVVPKSEYLYNRFQMSLIRWA